MLGKVSHKSRGYRQWLTNIQICQAYLFLLLLVAPVLRGKAMRWWSLSFARMSVMNFRRNILRVDLSSQCACNSLNFIKTCAYSRKHEKVWEHKNIPSAFSSTVIGLFKYFLLHLKYFKYYLIFYIFGKIHVFTIEPYWERQTFRKFEKMELSYNDINEILGIRRVHLKESSMWNNSVIWAKRRKLELTRKEMSVKETVLGLRYIFTYNRVLVTFDTSGSLWGHSAHLRNFRKKNTLEVLLPLHQ